MPAVRWSVAIPAAFFALILVVGLVVYDDYGVTHDEPIQRVIGQSSLYYITELLGSDAFGYRPVSVPSLENQQDRDYGVAFEMPVEGFVAALGLTEPRDIYSLRHLCTFLSVLLGSIALFRMATERYDDWRWGLVAAAAFWLTPRMFAESFYNSKDMVFLAAFALAAWAGQRLLAAPTSRAAAMAGIATAVAIDVRIMAVLIPLVMLVLLVLRAAQRQIRWADCAAAAGVYVAATAVVTVALWPWLWSNPVGNMAQAFSNMSHFRWTGVNMYMGYLQDMANLPWHYAPVWIAITLPIPILLMVVAGTGMALARVVRSSVALEADADQLLDAYFLVLALAPLVAVIVFGSTLYDGWRQLYFAYPAMLVLAVGALRAAYRVASRYGHWVRWPSAAIATIALAWPLGFMVAEHPLQNLYFNRLAGGEPAETWAFDYWGTSYTPAMKIVLANAPVGETVTVWADSSNPVGLGILMQDPADASRLIELDARDNPAFIVNNGNNVNSDPAITHPDYSNYDIIGVVSVRGQVATEVYRRR